MAAFIRCRNGRYSLHLFGLLLPDEGLIFRRFEYRRMLVQAARKVLGTEDEAKHLSAHDFRHAALTHMAAVGSDLTAIGHIAGHKNATTTALYVHNSEGPRPSDIAETGNRFKVFEFNVRCQSRPKEGAPGREARNPKGRFSDSLLDRIAIPGHGRP